MQTLTQTFQKQKLTQTFILKAKVNPKHLLQKQKLKQSFISKAKINPNTYLKSRY